MSGPSNFDIESFKQEILKEFRDEIQQMLRDMVSKIVGKRPILKPKSLFVSHSRRN